MVVKIGQYHISIILVIQATIYYITDAAFNVDGGAKNVNLDLVFDLLEDIVDLPSKI